MTRDGAELCGQGKATRTATGLKMVDKGAKDPAECTKYLFLDSYDNRNKYCELVQSSDNYYMPMVLLCNETKELVQTALQPSFAKYNDICESGIPAYGNELPVKGLRKTYGGNLSFLQKIMHRGGACKIKAHFCSHCACNGTLDLLSFKTGNERCNICEYNDRERCNHTAVLDKKETKRIF